MSMRVIGTIQEIGMMDRYTGIDTNGRQTRDSRGDSAIMNYEYGNRVACRLSSQQSTSSSENHQVLETVKLIGHVKQRAHWQSWP